MPLTPEEITEMSDAELVSILDRVSYGNMDRELVMGELTRRRLRSISKPHWTLTPSFWIAVTAMIFAAIAALPAILDFFQSAPSWDKAANSPPPQLQLPSGHQSPKTSAS